MNDEGTRVVVGSSSSDVNGYGSGQVTVYEWDGNSWNSLGQNLAGASSFERFGNFVDMSKDGTVIAVGYDGDDDQGVVAVYNYDGTEWILKGSEIMGDMSEDRSERIALSADGLVVVIGGSANDSNGSNAGHV